MFFNAAAACFSEYRLQYNCGNFLPAERFQAAYEPLTPDAEFFSGVNKQGDML
jgi:hypothetical protein